MNVNDLYKVVWMADIIVLIGIWQMVMGLVYILRGHTAGKVQMGIWYVGTLLWIGAISVLIRGGLV